MLYFNVGGSDASGLQLPVQQDEVTLSHLRSKDCSAENLLWNAVMLDVALVVVCMGALADRCAEHVNTKGEGYSVRCAGVFDGVAPIWMYVTLCGGCTANVTYDATICYYIPKVTVNLYNWNAYQKAPVPALQPLHIPSSLARSHYISDHER